MTTTTSATAAFDAAHTTPEYPLIYHRNPVTGAERLFTHDGSYREPDPFSTPLVGPPADPLERAEAIARYHRLRFEMFHKRIEFLKEQCQAAVQAGCDPDYRLVDEIDKLAPQRDASKRDYDRSEIAVQRLHPQTNLEAESRRYRWDQERKAQLQRILAK